jgi:hypothetical protein
MSRETDWMNGMRTILRQVFGTNEHARRSHTIKDEEFKELIAKADRMGEVADQALSVLGDDTPVYTIEEALGRMTRSRH